MRTVITTSLPHAIPVGADIIVEDGRVMRVISAGTHTITVRDWYWWERLIAVVRYWVRHAWRWAKSWVEAKRTIHRIRY